MADSRKSDPTEAELVAFATVLLSKHGDAYADDEFVAEAVRENRDLWLMLYEVTGDPPARPS